MSMQRQYQQAVVRDTFWQRLNLQWLPRLGGMLITLFVVAMLCATVWAGFLLYRWLDVPVMTVAIASPLQRVSRSELETVVSATMNGGFLSLNIDALCATLEAHPWIAEATVRRYWPDRIEISVVEEVAIARWGEHSFVNNSGQIMHIDDVSTLTALPFLSGPPGSVQVVMREYRDISDLLLGHGLKVNEFGMDKHHHWRMRLDAGFAVLLGQHKVLAKVRRFLRVWVYELKERKDEVLAIDARYENGIAVSWR